ncbi:MAG: hypothetical protein ACE14M_04115 [Terriglobales bacterium]
MTAFLRFFQTAGNRKPARAPDVMAQASAGNLPAALILHPKFRTFTTVILVAAVLVSSGTAQSRRHKRPQGPRALAVLEVTPNGRTRLVPITILDNGKFYDAGVYRADPRPMALDDGVVYEGERTGESLGLFTIANAQQVNGAWIGLGRWQPNEAPELPKEKPEPQAQPTDDDARPVLRRSPKTDSEATPSQQPAAAEAKSSSPAPERAESEPSGRPRLRRGKPEARDTEKVDVPPLTKRKSGAEVQAPAPPPQKSKRTAAPVLPPGVRFLTAISDAGGPEPRPFTYEISAADRQQFTKQLSAFAYAAIARFASARPAHKPAAATALAISDVRILDPLHNNEPVLVLTGRLPELSPAALRGSMPPAGEQEYWVTVVARIDMYNQLRQLFAWVTDTGHLDVYPRLELVDAVDADGDGAGELLFRRIFPQGHGFALYRVGMDKLWKLFEGAVSGGL